MISHKLPGFEFHFYKQNEFQDSLCYQLKGRGVMNKYKETGNQQKFRWKDLPSLLKSSFKDWNDDDAFSHAAAVSYYAIFSMPALLLLIINALGFLLGKENAQGKITEILGNTLGPETTSQVQTMITNSATQSNNTIMLIIGVAILIFSATGLFIQLQKALNRMWEVQVKPDTGVGKMIGDRARSLGIILAVGFLLLITFVITGALSALSNYITSILPDFSIYIFFAINIVLSFFIITLLFALIFKYLPDVKIQFRSVWAGAMFTAFLFLLGKYGLTLYFSLANPGSAYGAAGSLILILLWVYYSCLILFFGAEFTQAFANRYSHKIQPSSKAQKVEPCPEINRSYQAG